MAANQDVVVRDMLLDPNASIQARSAQLQILIDQLQDYVEQSVADMSARNVEILNHPMIM